MQVLLKVSGIALMLSGGLWVLQGLGLIAWPENSFMLSESRWVAIGIVALLLGSALLMLGSRKA